MLRALTIVLQTETQAGLFLGFATPPIPKYFATPILNHSHSSNTLNNTVQLLLMTEFRPAAKG